MDIARAQQQLEAIEAAINDGSYKKGRWQKLIAEIDDLSGQDKLQLAGQISAVSRALHARNGFYHMPFLIGLALEIVIFLIGIVLIGVDHVLWILAAIAALAVTLQPLIKVVTGLVLGVRYDYVFLWYLEPRFKMQYGTYVLLPPIARVLFHSIGGVGTPLAMFIGFVQLLPINALMAWVCFIAALGALAMQIGAFVLEWIGVRNVGGFRLSTLTSPATAAYELKRMRA